MHNFPPELLVQIFEGIPLLASHVCQRWRAISVNDPRLWDSPSVEIKHTTSISRLHLLELWLVRSASQPLNITITMDPYGSPPPTAHTVAISAFTLLTHHTPRWGSLVVVLPAAESLFSIFCAKIATSPPASILRTAHITLGNWSAAGSGAAGPRALLAHAPALRALKWSNRRRWGLWDAPIASGVAVLGIGGGWAGLTRIVLDTFVTPVAARAVLAQAAHLETLELAHLGSASADDAALYAAYALDGDSYSVGPISIPGGAPLLAPALRALTVYTPTLDAALPALLAHIACPALTRLALTCGFPAADAHSGVVVGTAIAALVEGATALETLVLEGTDIGPSGLAPVLTHAPALRRLEIFAGRGGACVDDALLDALTGKGEDAPLCPRLRALVLHRSVECADGALEAMLRARVGMSEHGHVQWKEGTRVARLTEVDIVLCVRQRATNARDNEYVRELRGLLGSSYS